MRAIRKKTFVFPSDNPQERSNLSVERGEIWTVETEGDHQYVFSGSHWKVFTKDSLEHDWNLLPPDPPGHCWVSLKEFSACKPNSFLIYDFTEKAILAMSEESFGHANYAYTSDNYGSKWIAAIPY